jgi:hypothetical protein
MTAVTALAFSVIAVATATLVHQHRAAGSPPPDPQGPAPVRHEAASGSNPADASKALAQEQLELAREALRDLDLMSKKVELSLTDPRFALWHRRSVEAIRASGAGKAERVAALEDYLKRMKDQERFAQVALERAQSSRVDVFDARYRVLEAEIWLNQEKAR